MHYGLQYNWQHTPGNGIAISFRVSARQQVKLSRMAITLWANDGAGPDLIPVEGNVYIRSNTANDPVGQILDLTVFAGVTITRNLGEPFATTYFPWEGCQDLSASKLYELITFPTTNGNAVKTIIFANL